MQRYVHDILPLCPANPSVFDVTYTPTADFVLSASDDGNVRIWKHNASDKIGPVSTKERQAIEYRKSLVDRWSSVKDVRSVKDRRHVPESIHNATKLKRDMIEARNVKEDRRRKHTRAGKEKPKAERKSACTGLWGWNMLTCRDCHQGAEVGCLRSTWHLLRYDILRIRHFETHTGTLAHSHTLYTHIRALHRASDF